MSRPDRSNIVRHVGRIRRDDRERLLGQRSCVLWFTGLSGSGKSTLVYALEERLIRAGHLAYVLDGDNVRHGVCRDLGFSPEERTENIRRVGEVAALFADAGAIVLCAFISPYRSDRQRVRDTLGEGRFIEVFVDAPLSVCEARDPKGLYKKARAGQIPAFTGVSAPYEAPKSAEVTINTDECDVDEAVAVLEQALRDRGLLSMTSAREPAP